MKNTIRSSIILATIILIGVLPSFAQRSGRQRTGSSSGTCASIVAEHFDALEATPLTEAEIDEVIFLREEEKPARDAGAAAVGKSNSSKYFTRPPSRGPVRQRFSSGSSPQVFQQKRLRMTPGGNPD